MVFCSGANHGGATNINIFYCIFQATVWFGDSRFKGIEVNDHQINGLDIVFLHDLVIGSAPTQYAAVNFGMQGLYSPVHHFREAGVI